MIAHDLSATGAIGIPLAPYHRYKQQKAHPGNQVLENASLVNSQQRDWRFYLTWTGSLRFLRDEVHKEAEYFLGKDKRLLRASPWELRANCVLVREVFDPGAQVCSSCALRGRQCRARNEVPVFETLIGANDAAAVLSRSNYVPYAWKDAVRNAAGYPDGFVFVSAFETRSNPSAVVPNNRLPSLGHIALHPDDLARNQRAKAMAQERSVESRATHMEVCGADTENTRCMFKGRQCQRWRHACSRRWLSNAEFTGDIIRNYQEQNGSKQNVDLAFAYKFGGRHITMISPYTKAARTGVYRGVVFRQDGMEPLLRHQFYSLAGSTVDLEFEGTLQGLMQFLRRWAPDHYQDFCVGAGGYRGSWHVPDEHYALLLCAAERRWIRSEDVYAVIAQQTGIVMKTRLLQKRLSSTADFAMSMNWPDFATE